MGDSKKNPPSQPAGDGRPGVGPYVDYGLNTGYNENRSKANERGKQATGNIKLTGARGANTGHNKNTDGDQTTGKITSGGSVTGSHGANTGHNVNEGGNQTTGDIEEGNSKCRIM